MPRAQDARERPARCAAAHVRGALHLSITYVTERWRSVPRPHRPLFENAFSNNGLFIAGGFRELALFDHLTNDEARTAAHLLIDTPDVLTDDA